MTRIAGDIGADHCWVIYEVCDVLSCLHLLLHLSNLMTNSGICSLSQSWFWLASSLHHLPHNGGNHGLIVKIFFKYKNIYFPLGEVLKARNTSHNWLNINLWNALTWMRCIGSVLFSLISHFLSFWAFIPPPPPYSLVPLGLHQSCPLVYLGEIFPLTSLTPDILLDMPGRALALPRLGFGHIVHVDLRVHLHWNFYLY